MHPILLTIGKYNISSYTVLLDLGLILALVVAYFEGKRVLGNGEQSESRSASGAGEAALDAGLWTIVGGILGGRIGFVLGNLEVFSENWSRALRIWEGGLSFHGAFLGGLAALILIGYLQSRSAGYLLRLADTLTPSLSVGLVFGWIACLLGGCVYGAIGEGLGYAVLPDLYGVEASRFATQAVGAGLALILLAAFWLLRRRWPFSGAAFLMLLLLYFTGAFFLEFTRGDEAIYVSGWRLAQLVDLGLAALAGAGLLALWWQARVRDEGGRMKDEEEVSEEAEEPVEEIEKLEEETKDPQ
ncbi:MAG: prolipoprotein diacylglyceryl transferase [Anaerolineae bacterium]|nr:prolipoprotein diacylglyceryl transferase [Anaerolineae bacterium]